MRLFGINLIDMKPLPRGFYAREEIITLEYHVLWWSWTRKYRGWVIWYRYPSGWRVWGPLDGLLCSYAQRKEWEEEEGAIKPSN